MSVKWARLSAATYMCFLHSGHMEGIGHWMRSARSSQPHSQGDDRGPHRAAWSQVIQEKPRGLQSQACGHQAAQGRCLQPC